MVNPAPDLNIPITRPNQAEVSLSKFTGPLVVSIPNDAELFPGGTVCAILGEDPEEPAWEGDSINAGKWQEDTEEYQRLSNLTVEVPKQVLLQFKGKTTQLRYQAIGESGLSISSEPISLTVTT